MRKYSIYGHLNAVIFFFFLSTRALAYKVIFPLQQNVTSSPLLRSSLPEGQANRHQQELQTEVEVLRQQLLVFQEDFDRERQDRATAQSIKDDLKKKCDQLKRQLRNNEVKLAGAETQVYFYSMDQMGLDVTKPVLRVSDQAVD